MALYINGQLQTMMPASSISNIRYVEADDVVQLYYDGQWRDWKSGGMAYPVGTEFTFDFTGTIQNFVIPATGNWQLEVWGAGGGYGNDNYEGGSSSPLGGKGGYAKGTAYFDIEDEIFIVVGGRGKNYSETATSSHSYNGGGIGGGGGATHIGLTETLLKNTLENNLLIVGGGGGGGSVTNSWGARSGGNAGDGGGLTGGNAPSTSGEYASSGGRGGSQSVGGSGANSGSYGQGGNSYSNYTCGGGGGYYGGGSGYMGANNNEAGGGGGSSFMSSILSNTQTISGDRTAGTNGLAKIKYLGR